MGSRWRSGQQGRRSEEGGPEECEDQAMGAQGGERARGRAEGQQVLEHGRTPF
jgi:hypothetical protein